MHSSAAALRGLLSVGLCVLLEVAQAYMELGRGLCTVLPLLVVPPDDGRALAAALGGVVGITLFPLASPGWIEFVACVAWAGLMSLDALRLLHGGAPAVMRVAACVLAAATLLHGAPMRDGGGTAGAIGFAMARCLLFILLLIPQKEDDCGTLLCRFGAVLFAPSAVGLLVSSALLFLALCGDASIGLVAGMLTVAMRVGGGGGQTQQEEAAADGPRPTPLAAAKAPPPPFVMLKAPLPPAPTLSMMMSAPPCYHYHPNDVPAKGPVDAMDVQEAFRLAKAQYLCANDIKSA